MASIKTFQERSSIRVPSSLVVKFSIAGTVCYGIATNISEKGMCIQTGECLPKENRVEFIIPLKGDQLTLPVSVIWAKKSNGFYDSMGVELHDTPEKYMQILDSFRNSC